MISSCYLQKKKLNLILDMASAGLVFAQIGSYKRAICESFSDFLSELQYCNVSYRANALLFKIRNFVKQYQYTFFYKQSIF